MTAIVKHTTKALKRGMPSYPTNDRMPTLFLVKLEGSNVWRRVYERFVAPGSGKKRAVFCAVVKELGGAERDLTAEEMITIGYHKE